MKHYCRSLCVPDECKNEVKCQRLYDYQQIIINSMKRCSNCRKERLCKALILKADTNLHCEAPENLKKGNYIYWENDNGSTSKLTVEEWVNAKGF